MSCRLYNCSNIKTEMQYISKKFELFHVLYSQHLYIYSMIEIEKSFKGLF